ncbi:MAG: hypothetical protein EOP45_14320, partial [Sphingobacteriaceae bacterium]
MNLLFKSVTLTDPNAVFNKQIMDVLVEDGKIVRIAADIQADTEVIDGIIKKYYDVVLPDIESHYKDIGYDRDNISMNRTNQVIINRDSVYHEDNVYNKLFQYNRKGIDHSTFSYDPVSRRKKRFDPYIKPERVLDNTVGQYVSTKNQLTDHITGRQIPYNPDTEKKIRSNYNVKDIYDNIVTVKGRDTIFDTLTPSTYTFEYEPYHIREFAYEKLNQQSGRVDTIENSIYRGIVNPPLHDFPKLHLPQDRMERITINMYREESGTAPVKENWKDYINETKNIKRVYGTFREEPFVGPDRHFPIERYHRFYFYFSTGYRDVLI